MQLHGRPIPRVRLGAALVSLLLLTGCWVKADHPFFTPNDCFLDPWLLGVWELHEESPNDTAHAIYEILPGEDGRSYNVRITRKNDPPGSADAALLQVWTARVDGVVLVCFTPLNDHTEPNPPRYVLYKLSRQNEILVLRALNEEWVATEVEAKRLKLAVQEKQGHWDDLYVNASTAELRPLLRRAVHSKRAFAGDPVYFTRKVDEPATH